MRIASSLRGSALFSQEAQQLLVETGQLRFFRSGVIEPVGRVPLRQIKLLTEDPVEQENAIEEIERRYAECFGT
jgi:hypothetical protein